MTLLWSMMDRRDIRSRWDRRRDARWYSDGVI